MTLVLVPKTRAIANEAGSARGEIGGTGRHSQFGPHVGLVDHVRAHGIEAESSEHGLPFPDAQLYATAAQQQRLSTISGFSFQFQEPIFVTFRDFLAGGSVRNIRAFQVLQSVFVKSNSTLLCCTILDAISSIYHSDNANYFILEWQNTLSQFAEKIHLKSPEIQDKFFQLLEFIVFQLNFVPCKELVSLSILLKSNNSVSCCIACMETLVNILR